ncbi:Basic-leucine zipper transcription factor family protein putative isoform 1 [Tripterygium wilfordii]|uniref:Basic-leucine zipper transcription factor family protein putative isoform 1 n=1 Tax=Tripterygium wilfordii TaxID=458696 RepID=A0A7J7DLL8_TRIWF|nr:probable transcription factor PosF21 [Tripterygium wilfordii]KAF5747159.1 Basic-leucine zipper transcription factor family protein putative isoform 1 [Tripterygium wilfordii]
MDGYGDFFNGLQRLQSPFGAQFSSETFLGGSQMGASTRQMAQTTSPEGSKRPGVQPSYPMNPPYSPFTVSRAISQQQCLVNSSTGASNSRSSHEGLPPLSPLTYKDSSVSSFSDQAAADASKEEGLGNLHGLSIYPSQVTRGNSLRVGESLPPRRGHRRSNSDGIPLGFNSMIQLSPQLIPIGSGKGGFDRSVSGREGFGAEKPIQLIKRESEWSNDVIGNVEAMKERKSDGEVLDAMISEYMNLDTIDSLNSSAAEHKDLDSRASGTKTNGYESSDNEVESHLIGMQGEGVKRSAHGASTARHHRSVSMDSYMGSFIFDDESLKVPAKGTQAGPESPGDSVDGSNKKLNLAFRNGEFSTEEWKKIIANEKLHEIALSDPKRVKRILANRISAARSKERKTRYISELEHKVQTLQNETTTLSTQVTVLQRDAAEIANENKELKFRLQAMEQQDQLKDALNSTLTAEVERLRLTVAELGVDGQGMRSMAPLSVNQRLFQLQQQQQLLTFHLQQQQQQNQQPQQHCELNGDQLQQQQQEQRNGLLQDNQLKPQQQNGLAANHESK